MIDEKIESALMRARGLRESHPKRGGERTLCLSHDVGQIKREVH